MNGHFPWKITIVNGKITIFNGYFDITRGYIHGGAGIHDFNGGAIGPVDSPPVDRNLRILQWIIRGLNGL